MFYDIVQVIPNEDYTVYVYFEDGKIVCYDAKTLLKKKVFEPFGYTGALKAPVRCSGNHLSGYRKSMFRM